MKKIHCVDDQGNVGCVLACRIGKLLLGDNCVFGQRVRPCLGARIGEIPVDPADAGFSNLRDLLEQPIGDLRGGVVSVDQNGKARRTIFRAHDDFSTTDGMK